jgi:hypothetical protein
MRTLWFKSEFVVPIMSGEKRDTIRRRSNRLPRAGEVVAFSVGPRPAFAHAVVESVESVGHIQALRRDRLHELIGEGGDMVRIRFTLLPSTQTRDRPRHDLRPVLRT